MNNKKILLFSIAGLIFIVMAIQGALASQIEGTNYSDTANEDGTYNFKNSNAYGQKITTEGNQHNITRIAMRVHKAAALASDLTWYLRNTTCTNAATCATSPMQTGTIPNANLSNSAAWVNWSTGNKWVQNATVYYIYLTNPSAGDNAFLNTDQSAPTYSGGTLMAQGAEDATRDVIFATYYNTAPPAAGDFDITITDDYNASAVTMNVTMQFNNGTIFYFNGTSTLDTNISSQVEPANITIESSLYETFIKYNWDINTDLVNTMNLTRGRVLFSNDFKDNWTKAVINGANVSFVDKQNAATYNFSTSGAALTAYLPKSRNYTVTITPNQHNPETYSFTLGDVVSLNANTTFFYYLNSVSFYVYNEETGELITGNKYIDLISDVYSANFTNTSNPINFTLLTPSDYTIRYSAPNFAERFYYLAVTDNSYNSVDLFLINASNYDNVTVTVVDQGLNPVDGAIVKAQKYDVTTNTYKLVHSQSTDVNGQVVLQVQKYTEFYKFIVQYNGDTLKTTSPSYLLSDAYTIQIVIGDDIAQEFEELESIDYNFNYNTATNNFRLTFNDVTGFTSQFCVKVHKMGGSGTTLINSSCLASASGTILVGITPVNGTTYSGKAYYYKGSSEEFLAGASYTHPRSFSAGKIGLFIQVILTLVIAGMAVWSIPVALILTPLSLIVGYSIGLHSLPISGLMVLQVTGVVIAFVLWKRS